MARKQQQSFCNRCNKQTLHTREIEGPNHGLHWVLILFCCGAWIPFYVLLLLFPTKHPWLCSVCGERMGHVPKEVKQQRRADKRDTKEVARLSREAAKQQRLARRVACDSEKAEKPESSEQQTTASMKDVIQRTGATLYQQVTAAIRQTNGILKTLAGDDVFLLRIFQALSGIAGIAIAGTVIYQVLQFAGFI